MANFTERQQHKIEIIPPYSIIQCREENIVEKDGVEISKTYHRYTRCPGEDVSNDCQELQAVANALWTPEVIQSYLDHVNSDYIPNTPFGNN